MTRVQMTQAVAEDYADAMLVARRAKNVLFLCLTLVLLIQLGAFFVARYVPGVKIRAESGTGAAGTAAASAPAAATDALHTAANATPGGRSPASTAPATVPATVAAAETPSASSGQAPKEWGLPFDYLIPVTDFLGVILSIVLAVVLVLIITIMLVGRLIGVSHVTGAFCWSIVLIVILFPWQTLTGGKPQPSSAPSATPMVDAPAAEFADMKIPGALYTFPELARDYRFPGGSFRDSWLKWSRYVGFPVAALFVLLIVHGRSGRGLRFALGEAEVVLETK